MKKARVHKITGADPAGPNFQDAPATERLDKTDADYVEIISTNPGLLGFDYRLLSWTEYIGYAIFNPNFNGQPGCELNPICAHTRAWEYYLESIYNPQYFAVHCDSYDNFARGKCSNHPATKMGESGNIK